MATLLLARSANAQDEQLGQLPLTFEDVPRQTCVPGCNLTPQERIDAARRIVALEVTNAKLKEEIKQAPSAPVLLIIGLAVGVVATGAVVYVIQR